MLFVALLGGTIWAINAAVIHDSANTGPSTSPEALVKPSAWDEQSLLGTTPAICTKDDWTALPTTADAADLESDSFGDMKPPRRGQPPAQLDRPTDWPLGHIAEFKYYAQKEAAFHFKCPYSGEQTRYLWYTSGWKDDGSHNRLGSITFQDMIFAKIDPVDFSWSRPDINLWKSKILRKWCKPQWKLGRRYQCKYTVHGILFGHASSGKYRSHISQTVNPWTPDMKPTAYEECYETCKHPGDPNGAYIPCAGIEAEVLACRITKIDDRTVRTNSPI